MAVAYYVAAKIGLALTLAPQAVSTLWPPNAILTAALLLTPTRWWWAVLLGAFPAHVLVELESGFPLSMVLCWFISNSAEALIAAGGVRWIIGERFRLDTFRRVGLFLCVTAGLAPFLSSFLDAAFVTMNGLGVGGYWGIWRARLLSNVLAELTLVPPIVAWSRPGFRAAMRAPRWRRLEAAMLAFGLVGVCLGVFGGYVGEGGYGPALLYAPLPFLLWAAVRFGPGGTSLGVLVVALLAIAAAGRGRGPFIGSTPDRSVLSIQLFLVMTSVPLLTLAAALSERSRAEQQARRSEERLRLVLDAAEMGTWEWEIEGDRARLSERTREMLGITRADERVTLDRFLDLLAPEDRPAVAAAIRRSVADGTPYDAEFRVVRPDGRVRWVMGKGNVVGNGLAGTLRLIGVNADITDRKRAERALRESEERFRSIFDMGVVPTAVGHADGRILDANDAYLDLVGFSRAEMAAGDLRWDRLTAPEHRARDAAAFAELAERGRSEPFEKDLVLRDGRRVPVLLGVGRLGPDCGILVHMDLTERKRATKELEDRLRFEQLISDLSAAFATQPLLRAEEQLVPWLGRLGKLMEAQWVGLFNMSPQSRGFQPAHEWTADGLAHHRLGRGDTELPWTEARIKGGHAVRVDDTGDLPPEAEVDRRHLCDRGVGSALALPLQTSGKVLGSLVLLRTERRAWPEDLVHRLRLIGGLFANVLSRKVVEGERRQAEAVNTAILASLPGMTAIIDGKGCIVRANAAWMRYAGEYPEAFDSLGVNGDLLEGCSRKAAAGDHTAFEVLQGLRGVLGGTRTGFTVTYVRWSRDGQERWYDLLAERLARREGGAVITILDSTARKSAERAAASDRAELARVIRVATMGELTASLAHELSQPLTAILSNAQAGQRLLARTPPDIEEVRDILADITENDRRAGDVVHRIRGLLKKGQLELRPVDANEVVRDVLRLLGSDVQSRHCRTLLQLDPELPPVWADVVQLQQVVLNLVLNGLEAMDGTPPGERRLTVATARVAGEHVELTVRDAGPGIGPGRLEQMFDPFFTTKPNGLGMGLSIARSIVHAYGGTIRATNNGDGGATVGFVLPASRAAGDV